MPRGVYDRSKFKKRMADKISLSSSEVAALRPKKSKVGKKGTKKPRKVSSGKVSRSATLKPLSQVTCIPEQGLIQKINDDQNRTIVTLDINKQGIAIYPLNVRRKRKARPRIGWATLSKLADLADATGMTL